jgi:hypothetical protein
MKKRWADALGALLSVSFLSCLFALLLVAEQAFPPARAPEGGIGLPGGIRGPLVVVGGSSGSRLSAPAVILPPAVAPLLTADDASLASVEPAAPTVSGDGREATRTRAERREARRRADRSVERDATRGPIGARAERKATGTNEADGKIEAPGHGGTSPGHGGTPPGHARKGGEASRSEGHGSVGTPPGHGGTPPGHGGTPPGQDKDHGGKGRGKGASKH